MKTILLKRIAELTNGTFGVVIKDTGIPWMLSCERPWMNNQHGISCIPVGIYKCVLTDTPKHGMVYQLQNVKDRDAILIHSGNTELDSEGCILLGKSYSMINDFPAVFNSKDALSEFMKYFDDEKEFNLRIVEA